MDWRMRFSRRETEAVPRLMACYAVETPTPVQTARAGLEVLEGTVQILTALGQPERAAHWKEQLRLLQESGAPLSLKELAVCGDDLLPLFRASGAPMNRMGSLLNTLWERAVCGELPNRRKALLEAAEHWLATATALKNR